MADTYLRGINRQIIDNSNRHFIILCGINAERIPIWLLFQEDHTHCCKDIVGGMAYLKQLAREEFPTKIFQHSKEEGR